MSKLLRIAAGLAMISALVVSAAVAGQNAGGVGKIGWLDSSNKLKTSRDETSCSPKMGLMVSGVSRLRGADCQLLIQGLGGGLPPSWQWWADANGSGCAAGSQIFAQGYKTSGAQAAADSVYNAWSQFPPVPGVATAQAGAQYYNVNPCLTPSGVGLIWFAAAGTSGVARNPAKTFGLFTLVVDQNSGCAGDCSDPKGVCILVMFRQPCSDPFNPRGPVFGVTDANNVYDFLPVSQPYFSWSAGNFQCPPPFAAREETWGRLKKAYH